MAASPYNLAAASGQNLTHSLDTIISEFRLLRDYLGVVRNHCTVMPLEPHTGLSKIVEHYGRVKAYSLEDGEDMAQAQALADFQDSYTPAEVGVQVLLANTTLRRVADPDLYSRVGRIMANAFELKLDQDLAAQFASFTTSIGANGTVLAPGHVLAAVTQLSVGGSLSTPEPAPGPYTGVFHPCSMAAVAARLVPLSNVPSGTSAYAPTGNDGVTVGPGRGGSDLAEEIIVEGGPASIGSLFGASIYRDANVAVSSTNATNAVYSEEGLIYVPEFEPYLDPDRDPSGRFTEVNIIGSYTGGVYRPAAYGVEILSDCTLPTS